MSWFETKSISTLSQSVFFAMKIEEKRNYYQTKIKNQKAKSKLIWRLLLNSKKRRYDSKKYTIIYFFQKLQLSVKFLFSLPFFSSPFSHQSQIPFLFSHITFSQLTQNLIPFSSQLLQILKFLRKIEFLFDLLILMGQIAFHWSQQFFLSQFLLFKPCVSYQFESFLFFFFQKNFVVGFVGNFRG